MAFMGNDLELPLRVYRSSIMQIEAPAMQISAAICQ
jgi:hypothetical protein